VDVVVWVLAFGGWPALMVTGMFLTGDLELPGRVDEWLEERAWRRYERERLAAERVPADEDFTTAVLVGDERWVADPDLRLTAGHWWTLGLRDDPTMLVVEQDDVVFEPHWCVYEIEELEAGLLWAVPRLAVPTIQKLLGHAVQPSEPWVPRQGAIHYPWKPVPAYVDRSLGATAAWVGRQEIGPGCEQPRPHWAMI
jgi:hypothetical protein